jgi:hypothetical protein
MATRMTTTATANTTPTITTTMTTTNGSDVRMREKKVSLPRQHIDVPGDSKKSSSTVNGSIADDLSTDSTYATHSRASTFEQAFFFGLSIDNAFDSCENLVELFYNACKYNHLELVKRCIEEKKVNVNEPCNNDYPLCIAR